MVYGHILLYAVELVLWPFTYILNDYVNDMYIIFAVYLGTMGGAVELAIMITLFTLAGVYYETDLALDSYVPWLELSLYIFFVVGGWTTCYYMT